jgi:pyruvate carboxylase subunit B
MKFKVEFDEKSIDIDVDNEASTFQLGDTSGEFEFTKENGRYMLRKGTKLYRIDNVKVEDSNVEFSIDGSWYKASVKDEQQLLLDKLGFKSGAGGGEGKLDSPMPGKILDIMVKEGDEVSKGQPVAILEAMKMENELKSPIDGVIKKIEAEVGQSVEKKTPILEIEALG